MPLTKKIVELTSKKYSTNITILGDYEDSDNTSILDNDNGTILVVSDKDQFYFKDQHRNLWLSVLDSFHIDGKQHYPELGDSYTLKHGVQYSFTTKEAIVEMASNYFAKHAD
ncbi:hypothetical protein [Flavobacterium sp. IB48]|uniref:hypothetical protein n=1 Tax=Flavobacterium sp. IB48 TaxID=2779375 RepID=UPI0018E7D271|nr:hypothetical protein [Flavobacterium sp. IB48]MBJ2126690.1 hypothetical protein [Flavobacterium sp. IB48]